MTAALVVLCGVSFAGKSTLAAPLAVTLPATVVSLDAINEGRGRRGGTNVVVDDTTSLRFLRDGWRSLADSVGASSVLAWVTVDPDVQRRRLDANRSVPGRGDVTDAVMKEHLASFESPTADEFPLRVDSALPIERQLALVADALRYPDREPTQGAHP